MPKIKYHCNICDFPYRTREEAKMCERQGSQPFLFEVGDVFEPKSGLLKPEEVMSFHTQDVVIVRRGRLRVGHKNVYYDTRLGEEPIKESDLKDNYKKVGSGGLRN